MRRLGLADHYRRQVDLDLCADCHLVWFDLSESARLGGPALLEAAALARLHEFDPQGQSGLVQRVLATYTQSLRRLLAQLRTARAGADREAMRHAAHTLKSSSASVGALDLSALCAQAEASLRDGGGGADEATLLDRLQAEGERILGGLSAQ